MTAKTFDSVFEKISLSEDIKNAFSNTTVKNIIIHKREKNLELHLLSEDILEKNLLQQLQQELLRQLPGVENVEIAPFFHVKQRLSEKEVIEKYWNHIVYEISSQSPVCKGIMKEAFWELEEKRLKNILNNI